MVYMGGIFATPFICIGSIQNIGYYDTPQLPPGSDLRCQSMRGNCPAFNEEKLCYIAVKHF